MPVQAGTLRHVISVTTTTGVADGVGGETKTSSPFATERAAIWPASAQEREESQKLEMEITHKIRVRYRPGYLPSMKITFGARTFEIVSIINWQERNVYLDILAHEDV